MSKTPLLFEPIEHDSVADAVVEQIEGLIVSGVLKQGRKLPSEREMAELFDVSRPKLREALKQLEANELIRVQHGEGTFIATLVGEALSPALMNLYARHSEAFFDYLEYRKEQEAFAASLAAQRATSADREIIEYLLESMVQAHDKQDEKAAELLDINFHSAIVDASHNSTLIHMMGSIYSLTRRGVFYNRSYLQSIDKTGAMLLQQHVDIGQAILAGDIEASKAAASGHLEFVGKSFQAGEERSKRERFAQKRRLLQGLSRAS